MKILSLNLSHNASCTIIENGEISFFVEEERLSKLKKDNKINKICELLKNSFFDYIYYTSFDINLNKKNFYKSIVTDNLKKNNITFKEIIEYPYHHCTHAFSAFYNSVFEEAIVLVVDNGGVSLKYNETEMGSEILSIFQIKYGEEPKNIFKICRNEEGKKINFNNTFFSIDTISIPGIYELFIKLFNFNEPGSIMGLSCYGKNTINKNLFQIQDNFFNCNSLILNDLIMEYFDSKEDICYFIQKECTKTVTHYLNLIKNSFSNVPICVSGGFFQNCVANYEFLKKGLDIFVDPICHDGGTSLGLAQYAYLKHSKDKKINKYSNLYLGPNIQYSNKVILKNTKFNSKKIEIKEVASLLKNKKSVAIFQGRSEIGPRALGNRSILFDPSDPLAKEKINLIKKREWFRPFAGTILNEYKDEWFDLYSKESSDYMSYALNIKENKRKLIPGICHIDNTCRAQTLKQKDNPVFYNLIKEFYNLTSIPILLNTSLNKSGKPLVENLEDLLDFLDSTSIDYVYLPEKEIIIYK